MRLYDHLFQVPHPGKERDFLEDLNPDSLETLTGCKLEPGLKNASPGEPFQFLRQGYFSVDPIDSATGRPVFNRTVALRDSWAKLEKKG